MMNTEGRKCADCAQDDDANTQTCNKGCTVKLFGVQIGVPTEDGGAIRKSKSTGDLPDASAAAAEEPSGYLSDGIIDRYSKSRKKGKPWSEAEHRSFLKGLEKLGKGNWKGISSKFVPSRNSSQVASHAQKYYNRLNPKAANKKRRRGGSVFDIALPHYDTNQPSQSNNGTDQSLHINATTSAAASKNVGEFKPKTSSAHVTISEKPPLSPRKLSEIPGYFTYQPTIYWVPMVSYDPRQNSNGRYAAVMPQPIDDKTFPEWHFPPPPSNSPTKNNELNLNIRNLTL